MKRNSITHTALLAMLAIAIFVGAINPTQKKINNCNSNLSF